MRREPETVLVFDTPKDSKEGQPVDTIRTTAVTGNGYDNYRYKGVLYPAWVNDIRISDDGRRVGFIVLNP